ncbi:bifunctional ADP-dependent NAD(P)H-hydrate dehydratase/NAD(P)H-hydrate epimerase [Deinococcus rubellus]|uniref:Bifunctional NAD(P)H-hydrate repair enzyme n=1 Tax=Deinococcus rubellus TaxID=1889240 RepID=A0ABY5YFY0_9DEIO|nr:NAD(P)H-hydrate dehydratase [Deinococcus rubellus]UWX63990.1 NAD(P)H-hydrate dehydratase [Deinococcus rubellus]
MAGSVLLPGGVKALDARLERAGLLDLAMETAGRAVADHLQQVFPAGRVLLLAGGGANGGDAWVAARHLLSLEREVTVLAQPPRHPLSKLNRKRLAAVGVTSQVLAATSLRRALAAVDVVVDGLLGTGFRPPLRAELGELVGLLNGSGLPVLSIDLPSGLDAASAELPEVVVKAAHTLTFSGLKPALIYGPAAHAAGQVTVAGLRIPPDWTVREAVALRPTDDEIAALLPKRFADAHKGTAGRVWVLGGHPGTLGAPALAGLGALRAGAGLVTIYSGADVPLITPELMAHRIKLSDLEREQKPDAVAVGMGLGPQASEVARMVLGWRVPTVVDADALQPGLAGAGHPQVIWTPHPGEAARLLGTDTQGITRDPLSAARALQEKFGGVVVLKGGPSTVATPDGLFVARGGHPGMASAGMGDTLSGILAALLGQGLNAQDAALAGVRLHSKAGELAGQQHGYGLMATDVSGELGRAWLELVGGA